MNNLAKTETRIPRYQFIRQSIYGFWEDPTNSIVLKISPNGTQTRIKIIDVHESVVERISFYCGLQFSPKRTKWRGFDFITHLQRANSGLYTDGQVHMPGTTRKNTVCLTVVDYDTAMLEFYFDQIKGKKEIRNFVGSLRLVKKIPEILA
jgi:hypothetical protein